MQISNNHSRRILLVTILFVVLPSLVRADGDQMNIQPRVVNIFTFFSGVNMNITCDIPPGSQAVLIIRGKKIEEELMRKTHRWELWINRGEVDIDNAPILYFALSSESRLLSEEGDSPWGYKELEKEAKFSGSLKKSETNTIFREFVQLKERDDLYRLCPEGLKIRQISPDRWQVHAGFHLPSRIKPGTYQVILWIVKNGAATDRKNGIFEVRQKGLPEFLHSLAMKNGVLYGFLAVAVAMGVGLLIGLVFNHGKGGH